MKVRLVVHRSGTQYASSSRVCITLKLAGKLPLPLIKKNNNKINQLLLSYHDVHWKQLSSVSIYAWSTKWTFKHNSYMIFLWDPHIIYACCRRMENSRNLWLDPTKTLPQHIKKLKSLSCYKSNKLLQPTFKIRPQSLKKHHQEQNQTPSSRSKTLPLTVDIFGYEFYELAIHFCHPKHSNSRSKLGF